ncbi:MAG: paraquat-inducible protein A [Enterobacterales bacterium]|nr:paraquat-inducible protein A [Enterobacterales bacterium]
MLKDTPIACHECDLILKLPLMTRDTKAACPRCGFVFTRYFVQAKSKLLAFSLSALIFFALSFYFPFLNFSAQGSVKSVTLLQSLMSLGSDTYLILVVFMLITTVIVPLLMLIGMIYVLISTYTQINLPQVKPILRGIFHLKPWNMTEIFLLGILVSMVKIQSLAQVQFGFSFYAFTLYVVSMALTRLYLDRYQCWNWIKDKQKVSLVAHG